MLGRTTGFELLTNDWVKYICRFNQKDSCWYWIKYEKFTLKKTYRHGHNLTIETKKNGAKTKRQKPWELAACMTLLYWFNMMNNY